MRVDELRSALESVPDSADIEVEQDWMYDEYCGSEIKAVWSSPLTDEEREGLIAWSELNIWYKDRLKKRQRDWQRQRGLSY